MLFARKKNGGWEVDLGVSRSCHHHMDGSSSELTISTHHTPSPPPSPFPRSAEVRGLAGAFVAQIQVDGRLEQVRDRDLVDQFELLQVCLRVVDGCVWVWVWVCTCVFRLQLGRLVD